MTVKKVLFIPSESADPIDLPSFRTGMRLEEGLYLWLSGRYEKIIVSGGIVMPRTTQTKPLGLIMSTYLTSVGVLAHNIISENQSLDTYENISFVDRILQSRGYKPEDTELTIVSQWQHAWRAALTAQSYGYRTVIHTVNYPFGYIETIKEFVFMFCHLVDRKGTGIIAQYNRQQRHSNTTK